jgi:membrane protein DedA with SNARE-associated domain
MPQLIGNPEEHLVPVGSALLSAARAGGGEDLPEFTGLSGLVVDVIAGMGEIGVGILTLLETVFPPIPSEVILPLAGYLAERGRLSVAGVLFWSTLGSVIGAWVLYGLGRRLGADRAAALLARLPLVSVNDVRRATDWFDRHGPYAVLLGRLVPGVRSLISIPAGTTQMPVLRFTVLTLVGSAAWNGLLVGAGFALGTQWHTVERYADLLDYVLIGALVIVVAVFVVRRLRRRRRARAGQARARQAAAGQGLESRDRKSAASGPAT